MCAFIGDVKSNKIPPRRTKLGLGLGCTVEKLAGDLSLGLKFVKLEILSISFMDFLYDKIELRNHKLLTFPSKGVIIWAGFSRYYVLQTELFSSSDS